MLLRVAIIPVSIIRKVLRPILRFTGSVDLPVDIFHLNHEHSVTGNDDMIHLGGIVPVTEKDIVINAVDLTWQVFKVGGHPSLTGISQGLRVSFSLLTESTRPKAVILLDCHTGILTFTIPFAKPAKLNTLHGRLDNRVDTENHESGYSYANKDIHHLAKKPFFNNCLVLDIPQ